MLQIMGFLWVMIVLGAGAASEPPQEPVPEPVNPYVFDKED